jgi:hypothetical protein
MHPGETLGADDDTRLLERLAHRGVGGLLAGVHDAGDRRQRAVVSPSEEHLVAADDDGGRPGEEERVPT